MSHSVGAWLDYTFSRLNPIHECDEQTDGQTDMHTRLDSRYRAVHVLYRRALKIAIREGFSYGVISREE